MDMYDVFNNSSDLAEYAANKAVEILNNAIKIKGWAIWVISGGSAPMLAYKYLVYNHKNSLDWSRVYIILGDERCDNDYEQYSNWFAIDKLFLSKMSFDYKKLLKPGFDEDNIAAAIEYSKKITTLFSQLKSNEIDLLWLGLGEDGHTLSLFPGFKEIENMNELVIPVFNSPKAPANRISLGLKCLENVNNTYILAPGVSKQNIIPKIVDSSTSNNLPILKVISYLKVHGSKTNLMLDKESAELI